MIAALDSNLEPLVQAVSRRRLIPFVGAGFSAAVGLPRWHELLAEVASTLSLEFPYEELSRLCGNDPLRIAEYLHLVAGREIGPIRHRISRALMRPNAQPLSSIHVELANLGARLIYTTNYDDVIEQQFLELATPLDVIALPRHIAHADGSATELVKFHGDLQWEDTLVLTESSYFDRLQLESPLDVKFRSDLLGNSVLFLGYGLGDVNVRVIWHRLVSMMSEIPVEERPKSFIVRTDRNPVLEALDASVGITTITLDDDRLTREDRVARFLLWLQLSAACSGKIPGGDVAMHMSPYLLGTAASVVGLVDRDARQLAIEPFSEEQLVDHLAMRRIPSAMEHSVATVLTELSAGGPGLAGELVGALSANYFGTFGGDVDQQQDGSNEGGVE